MGKRYVIREEDDYSAAGGCLVLLIFIIAFAVYLFFTILPFIAAFAAGFVVFMLAEHILIEYKAKHAQVVAILLASLSASIAFAYTKPYSDSVLLRYMSDLSIEPTPSSLESSLSIMEWSNHEKYEFKDLSNCYHIKRDATEVFGCKSGYYLKTDNIGRDLRCTISDARITKKENENERASFKTGNCTSKNKS